MDELPLIIAHRGASSTAPENTLMAYVLAFMQGADGIEVDLRMTSDGHWVAVHDEDMERTAGQSLRVARTTLEKLRRLDVGRKKIKSLRGQKVPTLEEVVKLVPADKLLVLDIKTDADVMPLLAEALKKSGLSPERVRLVSADVEVLMAAKALLPQWSRWLVCARRWVAKNECWWPSAPMMAVVAKSVGAEGVSIDARSLIGDPEVVAVFRESGLKVHVWGVNRVPNALRVAELGADSIVTDYPGQLVGGLVGAFAG
jgi:glycerophosphoryl diester phosphodiesterase